MTVQTVPSYKRVGAVLRLKCPRCGKAKVFYKTRFPFNKPVMKSACESCGYTYDRKPGFFAGAFYLSVGIALLQGVIAYWLAHRLIYAVSDSTAILSAVAVVVFFAMWNYKLARVVWLNLFP